MLTIPGCARPGDADHTDATYKTAPPMLRRKRPARQGQGVCGPPAFPNLNGRLRWFKHRCPRPPVSKRPANLRTPVNQRVREFRPVWCGRRGEKWHFATAPRNSLSNQRVGGQGGGSAAVAANPPAGCGFAPAHEKTPIALAPGALRKPLGSDSSLPEERLPEGNPLRKRSLRVRFRNARMRCHLRFRVPSGGGRVEANPFRKSESAGQRDPTRLLTVSGERSAAVSCSQLDTPPLNVIVPRWPTLSTGILSRFQFRSPCSATRRGIARKRGLLPQFTP